MLVTLLGQTSKLKYMKKVILMLCFLGVLVSCKPKQTIVSNTIDRRSQVAIKGNWTLTSVTFTGDNYFKITAFEIADAKCFEGSTWNFVSNNDSGKMELTKSGCPQYASDIKWYVNQDKQFVLKFLTEGAKARKVTQGYILTLANQTQDFFQLIDNAKVGSNSAKVVYEFRKNK